MEYREPQAITREDAANAFQSSDVERINEALAGLTFHDPDGGSVEDQCACSAEPFAWRGRAVRG